MSTIITNYLFNLFANASEIEIQQVCTQQQEQASAVEGLVGEIHGDIKKQASVIGGIGSKVGDIKELLEQQGNLHADHNITNLNQLCLGTVHMD